MNKKNQLFRILPDIDIINKILSVFGLTSLDDTNMITKDTIKENNTVERLIEMKNELEITQSSLWRSPPPFVSLLIRILLEIIESS